LFLNVPAETPCTVYTEHDLLTRRRFGAMYLHFAAERQRSDRVGTQRRDDRLTI